MFHAYLNLNFSLVFITMMFLFLSYILCFCFLYVSTKHKSKIKVECLIRMFCPFFWFILSFSFSAFLGCRFIVLFKNLLKPQESNFFGTPWAELVFDFFPTICSRSLFFCLFRYNTITISIWTVSLTHFFKHLIDKN